MFTIFVILYVFLSIIYDMYRGGAIAGSTVGFQYMRLCTGPGNAMGDTLGGRSLLLPDVPSANAFMFGIKG